MTIRIIRIRILSSFADPPAAENLTPETKDIVLFKKLN
jgi:hypothetical protein